MSLSSSDWRLRAACRGRTDLMFSQATAEALALCARCPVQAICAADPDGGVPGGRAGDQADGATAEQRANRQLLLDDPAAAVAELVRRLVAGTDPV